MNIKNIQDQINKLEYHQSLLLEMITESRADFYKLVIRHSLQKEDVEDFFQLCTHLSNKMEEQKKEGFVYFQPLFDEFESKLNLNLRVRDIVHACIKQQLFLPLMTELNKYVL